jgi:hypothetical protein
MTDPISKDAPADDDGPTNEDRAQWAEVALLAFGRRTGTVKDHVGDNEDPFLILSDLLADLAHWCDRHGVDLPAALVHATRHYHTETGGEGRQLQP